MMENENAVEEKTEKVGKRDEWEIKEDLRAVKRSMAVFKDPERLKDVQDMIEENQKTENGLKAIADGDLKTALGL